MDNMTKFLKHFLYVPLAFVVLGILSSCGGGGGGSSVVAPTMTVTNSVTPPVTVITAMTVFSTATITALVAGDDYTVNLQAANAITSSYTTPTDFSLNYGLAQIGADKAYERGYFGQSVTVAIYGEGIRTTHIDLTANLLNGIHYDGDGNTITNAITDTSASTLYYRGGSDTFAAGIIAAAVNNTLVHGVAPQASILPLQVSGVADAVASNAFKYAADNSVHVLHNGWNQSVGDHISGLRYYGLGLDGTRVTIRREGGAACCFYYIPSLYGDGLPQANAGILNKALSYFKFDQIAAEITTADIAMVWAAGDHGWNGETGRVVLHSVTAADSITGTVALTAFLESDTEYNDTDDALITISALSLDANFAGGFALGPVYEPSLLGRWTHAVAVDSNSVIASFSNGCGTDSKYWCLAAPGVNITGLDKDSDDGTITESSTAYSAAYVSGALAVLKSRLPDMPMSVILALLFETATDLGINGVADGVDDIYGHGLLNLEKAITVQGNVGLVFSTASYTLITASVTSAMTTAVTTTVTPVITTIAITNTVFSTTAIATATFSDYTVTLQAANTITGSYNTAAVGYTLDYGLAQIGAHHAYERGYFGQGVTVAIFGEGIRTTHIDLTANLIPGVRYNSDGITSSSDITDGSSNFGAERASGYDTFGAGIIGAAAGNNTLAHGIAPDVSMLPLRGGDGSNGPVVPIAAIVAAFSHAATSGIPILHNGWNHDFADRPNSNDGRYNGSDLGGSEGVRVYLPPLSGISVAIIRDIDNHFSQITAAISTADMALVWAAGDFGWNTETGEVALVINTFSPIPASLVSINDFLSGYSFVEVGTTTRISLATLSLDPNFAGGYALGPTYELSLLGRWAHAVAVDSSSVIASFSNGCGRDTKYWCLAAPGVDLSGLTYNNNMTSITGSGTAYSAAYVSGALAVLKSRLPDMPMSVILALLFHTATDLGETGVDDVYGHGLLNLERAITVQGDISLVLSTYTFITAFMTSAVSTMTATVTTTVTTAASANNNLLQSKSKVSPLLAALKEQLREVSAAVEFLPGYYYNTPLGALIEVSDTDSNLSNLGGAASAMLSQTQSREMGFGLSVLENKGTLLQVSHKTEFGRFNYDICKHCETSLWEEEQTTEIATPFFASNRPQMSYAAKLGELEFFAATGIEDTTTSNDYQQYGIRLGVPTSESGNENSGFLEFSRTTEEDTLYGGEYSGAFALSGSETYQGRLHTERALSDNWRGMADYQFGWTNSEAQSGGLITDISRLRFDGLQVGVEGSSLFGVPFGGGGLMRFGITRQSGIRSGTIRLRYGVATTSEFIEDYQYALNNGYEVVEREFSLATRPTTLYHWGYTFAPRAQMQAAFGLEYNATANNKDSAAASLVLNWSY